MEELLVEMDLTWTGNQKFQLQVGVSCSIWQWLQCQAA